MIGKTKVDRRNIKCPKCNLTGVLVRRGKIWTKSRPHERIVYCCSYCGKYSVRPATKYISSYFLNSRYDLKLLSFLRKLVLKNRSVYDSPNKYWNKKSKESLYYSNMELREKVYEKFKKKFPEELCVN